MFATSERLFSAMKIVKNKLRNKIENEFQTNYVITYTERRIAEKFNTDSVVDQFYDIEQCRV